MSIPWLDSTTLVSDLFFPECLRWHNDRLWFSDFYRPAVMMLSDDGTPHPVLTVPGEPAGLGWLSDGSIIVVSRKDRRLLRWDGTELQTLADFSKVAQYCGNDLYVSSTDVCYVTHFGMDLDRNLKNTTFAELAARRSLPTAPVLRVDTNGTITLASRGLRFPNGVDWLDSSDSLLVAETLGERLTLVDENAEGGLREFASLPGVAPDGISCAPDGSVWVANAGTRECLHVSATGHVVGGVHTQQFCFGCCLGCADGRTLFMGTAADSREERARQVRSGHIEAVRV